MTAPVCTLTPEQQHRLRQLLRMHDKLQGWESTLIVSLARGIAAPTSAQWAAIELIAARILFGIGR